MADVNAWWDFLKTLPAADMPDNAYDALRDQFFYKQVAPELASSGKSPEASKASWMSATTRPGKSNWPKTDLAAAVAGKALLAPVLSLSGKKDAQDELEKFIQSKRLEASKQGSGSLSIGATEMVGEMVGTAPYFALGIHGSNRAAAALAGRLGVGKSAGQAAALASELGPEAAARAGQAAWDAGVKSLQHLATIPAAGAVQGVYDAAKAQDGHRLVEGLQGAAIGTAAGGVFEGLLNPRAVLKVLHGLGGSDAQAVLNVAKGIGTDADHAIANGLVSKYPNISGSLEQWLKESVEKAKKTATPREPLEIAAGSKFSIVMRGADGKEYNLYKQDPAKIDRLVEVVDKHLQKGGEIIKVNGSPDVVNKLYLQFENFARARGEYELPVTIKGGDPDAGPLMLWKQSPEVEPTSLASKTEGVSSPAAPSGGKIGVDQISPTSFLEQMPDGSVLDKKSGARYSSMEIALRANKIKYEVRNEYGSWYLPDGSHRPVSDQQHASVAKVHLKTKGIAPTDDWDAGQQMFAVGAIRRAQDGLEMTSSAVGSPAFNTAIQDMWETAVAKRWKGIVMDVLPDAEDPNGVFGNFFIPTDKIGEVFMEPRKALRAAKAAQQAKRVRKFELNEDINNDRKGSEVNDIRDLEATLAGKKPAALLDTSIDSPKYDKLRQQAYQSGLEVRSITVGNGHQTTVVGKKEAVESLEQAYRESNQLGELTPDLHKRIGQALGYSEKAINEFIDNMSKQGETSLTGKTLTELKSLVNDKSAFDEVFEGMQDMFQGDDIDEWWAAGNELFARLKSKQKDAEILEWWNSKFRKFDLNEDIKAKDSFYHGTTPEGIKFRERPTHIRGVGRFSDLPPAYGVTQPMGEGRKPLIVYAPNSGNPNIRGTVFHENIHGALAYMGKDGEVANAIGMVPGTKQLQGAFTPEVVKLAGPYINEEVVTHLTSAIRTKDGGKLQAFVNADGSLEEVMQVGANVAQTVKEIAMTATDSQYQRQLIRQMDDVIRRAGSIVDLKREATLMGDRLNIRKGVFELTSAGRRKTFKTRDELVTYMEENYREPLNAPNLLDESHIPSMPKFALQDSPQSPPLTTDPVLTGPSSGRVHGGVQALSFFVRPFYAWLETVSRKNNYPELYTVFKAMDGKQAVYDRFVMQHENTLLSIFKGYKPNRRSDLYHYLETPAENKDQVAQALNLTKKEIADATRLREEFYDPLFQQLGIDSKLYVEDYAPRLREANYDPSAVKPGGRLAQGDIDFFARHVRTGELDPRDTDALRVSHAYLRIGAKEKFLGEDFKRAAEMVNEKLEDGSFKLGTLQPLIKRHLEYMQGRPDFTQKMVDGAMQSAINLVNEVLEDVNKKLPSALQLGKVELPASDVLGRFMLFSYAGTLGMRPMTLVRDGMQLLMTTYPMLGEKYLASGLNKAFGKSIKGGQARKELWDIPEQYGVIMHRSDLASLYSGGSESLATSTAAKIAEKSLKPMEWENNANRLVAFWGHADKAFDAIAGHQANPKQMLKSSGLIYLDKPLQESFMQEIASATPQQWKDISYRMAKELVDVSQWNYRRGAMPGAQKYALGRLFGQYSSWPMNYWEYARRLTMNGDVSDKVQAGTRLAAMHYAVLKVGEGMGIDTASWVFTGPAAYGGSPIFSAVTKAPTALDTQSSRGDEAREQLYRMPMMSIPGGLAGYQWYRAVTDDNPHEVWKVMLGFDELSASEAKEGVHNLP